MYQRLTTSRQIREQILRAHPKAATNPAYQRLLLELYFPTHFEKKTGRTVLCRRLLARIEGKLKELRGHRYVARTFLKAFQRDVMPELQIERWEHDNKKCRSVLFAPLDREITRQIHRMDILRTKDRVYVDTGERYSKAHQRQEREARKKVGQSSEHNAICGEQRNLLLYMNELPQRGFTEAVSAHWSTARDLAQTMRKTRKLSERGYRVALKNLNAVADQPQPFYRCSSNRRTVRLFSVGYSLLTLKSELRQAITQDWVDFDLASAQLAINAALWDVPEALDWFKERTQGLRESIWSELFIILWGDRLYKQLTALGSTTTVPWLKDILKRTLYSALYGMDLRTVKRRLTRALKGVYHEGTSRDVFAHPVLRAMVQARDIERERIRLAGGAEDCFGNFYAIDPGKEENAQVRSIMARRAQAVELQLLYPVVQLAMSNTRAFHIMLWQHDGFSVNIHDRSRAERWIREIQTVVHEQAKRLSIPTVLEVSHDGR